VDCRSRVGSPLKFGLEVLEVGITCGLVLKSFVVGVALSLDCPNISGGALLVSGDVGLV